jgi:hypothetical protein
MTMWVKKKVWQNFLAGSVLALGPGVCVAMMLLGAGRRQQSSVRTINIASFTLYWCVRIYIPNRRATDPIYSTFVCVCMICGAIVNMSGPRVILSVASLGYPACIAIFWVYHIYGDIAILVLDAALLGCCAALAWTCSTFVSYAYPVRHCNIRYQKYTSLTI